MSGEPTIQLTGFVYKDPELRTTKTGATVAKFKLKVTPFNSKTQERKEASWYQINVWQANAERVAETVKESDRVVVNGTLEMESYEKDGQKRTVPVVTAYTVGVLPAAKPVQQETPQIETPW